MPPEEEFRPEGGPAETPATAQPEHRRRRSGRGRRGRGRRSAPKPLLSSLSGSPPGEPGEPLPAEDVDTSPEMETVPPASKPGMAAPAGHSEPAAAPQAEEPESTGPATIQDAIEQVNDVIEKLRQSLDEMEEVLEMLETIERQSTTDQQEIDSLRRALRPLQRPREGHRSQR